jgi:hypothetical protein
VTNSARVPIGGATVTAVSVGGGIRSTVSGSDGIYSFADVPPGSWSLTITVDGSPDVVIPAHRHNRTDRGPQLRSGARPRARS